MELKSYVFDKETVHELAEVSKGEESSRGKGALACTSKRVVFVGNNDVTDISINSVDAMEYSKKRYPKIYGITGSALTGLSILSILFFVVTDVNLALPIGLWGGIFGLILIGVGVILRKATLQIHTPNETFTFTSGDDLESMAHMIRAQESK